MAQLTWRDIAAPDLSGSIQGVGQFTNLLNNALANARGTVNEIDQTATDNANAAALRQMAGVTDANVAKALLSSAAIQNNARLTAPTLMALEARPGQLTQQAAAEQNLNDVQYASNQGKAADALASTVSQAQTLARSGDIAGAQALMASHADDLNKIGLKNSLGITNALDNSETTGVDLTGKRLEQSQIKQNMNQSATRFGWDVRDDKDKQVGMSLYADVNSMSDNPQAALAAFSAKSQGMTPGAKMFALQQLNSTWGNIYQPQQLAQMAGFTGSSGSPSLGMTYGGGQIPDSIQTIGDLVSNKDALLKANGATPVGLYQINAGTWQEFGQKALGNNWQQANLRDPAVQDKVGNAIWDSVKNNPAAIAGRWASISPAQAASLKGKSWDQVRDVISRGESGTSASSVLGTSQGAALRMGQDAAGKSNASALIQAAASPTQNPRDIVTGLQQGAFAGTDAGFLNNRINQIVNSSKVNGQATITPSQAGVILQDALRVNNHSWGITNFLEGNSVRVNKNGDRLSQDYIDNEVARAKSGGLIQDAVRQGDVATGVQTLAQAQAARDAAQAQLVATRQRMVSQPGLQFQIPRLQAQLDAANAILIKAQGNVNTSAAPVVQPPAPKPGEPGSHWYDGLFTLHRN